MLKTNTNDFKHGLLFSLFLTINLSEFGYYNRNQTKSSGWQAPSNLHRNSSEMAELC